MCSQTPGWHPPSPTHHTLKCGPDWLLCPGRSDIETPLVAPGCNYKGIQLEWKVTHTFRTGFVGLGPERELVSKPLPRRVQETEAEGSWCAWPFVSRRTWGAPVGQETPVLFYPPQLQQGPAFWPKVPSKCTLCLFLSFSLCEKKRLQISRGCKLAARRPHSDLGHVYLLRRYIYIFN